MIDNPMTRNTDYYPFHSKREYMDNLEERIADINNQIDELKNELSDLIDELENLN